MRRPTAVALVLSFLTVVSLQSVHVYAADSVKEIVAKQYKEEKDICPVVKKNIQAGVDTLDVTKSSIQLGHDACLVVQCAIEAKGSLERIVKGALEAGTTEAVVTRCAMQAGAEATEIAKALEEGLGYSPLAGPLTPVEIGLPETEGGGEFTSPSVPE